MRFIVSCTIALILASSFLPAGIFAGGVAVSHEAYDDASASVVPLPAAHAHNDYEHPRPLFDALDRGFGSVEADVFLVQGNLLVGHTQSSLRPERTLEKLYLDPLRARIKANGGRVYKDGPTIWLLVDVKTEAKATYQALDKVLARYDDILSVVKDGHFEKKAVTVVVSGNRAKPEMAAQKVRYAGIDGRSSDLDSKEPAHLMPWISDNWTLSFRWRGDGAMSDQDRSRLRDLVAKAHQYGRLVRFWGTPENEAFWKELRAAHVDLINTDQLDKLKKFLLAER
jgi:Glycerophosphoryl diester phosphodiesterase family